MKKYGWPTFLSLCAHLYQNRLLFAVQSGRKIDQVVFSPDNAYQPPYSEYIHSSSIADAEYQAGAGKEAGRRSQPADF